MNQRTREAREPLTISTVRGHPVAWSRSAPARRRGCIVRLIGRLPFQGRHGTLRLIRLCHDADTPQDVRLARSRLRHAVVMNSLRHVAPLPAGALAVLGWATLARQLSVPCAPVAWAAAVLTALLERAGALAAYAQACIHLTLALQLRTGPRPARQQGGAGVGSHALAGGGGRADDAPRSSRHPCPGGHGTVRGVPPGVAVEISTLVAWWAA